MVEVLARHSGARRGGDLSRALLLRGTVTLALVTAVYARAIAFAATSPVPEAVAAVADRDMVASVTLLIACLLAGTRMRSEPEPAIRVFDAGAVVVSALLCLLPHTSAGWFALGVIGLHGTLAWRQTPAARAAAAIVAAVFLYEIGGRLLTGTLAPVLAEIDALAAMVLLHLLDVAAVRDGNVIETGNGYDLVVVKACLSARSILQSLLVFFAITRFVRPGRWLWSEGIYAAILIAMVFFANSARLSLYAIDFTYYDALHAGDQSGVFGLAVVALAVVVAAVGVRHELDLARLRPQSRRPDRGQFGGQDINHAASPVVRTDT